MQLGEVLPVTQTIDVIHRLVGALAQLMELRLAVATLSGCTVPDLLIRDL